MPKATLDRRRREHELRRERRENQNTDVNGVMELLRDGAWHSVDDLNEATRFPGDWVEELEAEGLVDVNQGL
jgi:hypothetical protein